MKVVSDTSPIIAFSNLGKLHILKALFGRITIPRAVYEELSEGKPFQPEDWIQVEGIKDRGLYKMLRSGLDHGESEAIILYFEKEMDLLLLDDGEVRKVAASFEVTFTGTGGRCRTLAEEGARRLGRAGKRTEKRVAQRFDSRWDRASTSMKIEWRNRGLTPSAVLPGPLLSWRSVDPGLRGRFRRERSEPRS